MYKFKLESVCRYLISLLILLLSFNLCAQHAKNFTKAKQAARLIWNEHRETFYCQCPYDKHGVINFKKCHYQPKDARSTKRISWEHVVPVSWYGHQLACWRQPLCHSKKRKEYKGRNCCKKISPSFRKMEADLHNLVPAISEVNMARENFRFGEYRIQGDEKQKYYFNHCSIILDKSNRLVEPSDEVKGMAARITLYIADKYGVDLGDRQRTMLADWNNRFKVTTWEKQRNQKIADIQGDSNYYIEPQGIPG
ncbi:MAG: endonuclease [Proteobacteria bacterium]|nr:endonuclease [Pseudomonadota bacterium]